MDRTNERVLSAPGYETPVVVHAADQIDPVVHGARVAWVDWRNNEWYEGKIGFYESLGDIYSYDIVTHLEQPEGATTSDYGKFTPNDYSPVITDAGIFWILSGRSDADTHNEIRGRTLTGEPVTITQVIGEHSNERIDRIAVDGNRVVYALYDYYEYRLVLYDIASRHVYTIRQTEEEIRSPVISGDTIAWQQYNGHTWNVYTYRLSEGLVRSMSVYCTDPMSLDVEGTTLVWSDDRNGDWDLYVCDLTDPFLTESALIVAAGDQVNPQISGDRVVWQDNRYGSWDIYLGSLTNRSIYCVCDALGNQESPMIDDDRIVWQDKRNGDWDIYMFTLSSGGPTPVPTPAPLIISAPGTYSIAADGFDGHKTPIEIRSSNVVLDGGGHIIDGANSPGTCGIRIAGSGTLSNIRVKNIRLVNWETGIHVENCADSVIESSTMADNFMGIVFENVQNVQVKGNRFISNDLFGVWIRNSRTAGVRDNEVTETGDGFTHILYEMLDLITHDVRVSTSTGTEVTGNVLAGPNGGLNLAESSATLVTANRITGGICGIFSPYSSADHVVFNNYINASTNVYGSLTSTRWNTTPTSGRNIVGGPQIGGNFWAKPDGTGFSETHPDANGDGFCDEPFEVDWNSFDRYPLANWSGPMVVKIPGAVSLPRDKDDDGLFEDVNGNDRKDFADVVLYFNQMTWIAANEPLAAFDYNENGRIDFADVTWLFNNL